MKKKILGNQQLVRRTNQRLIIEHLRQKGSLSRADLSKVLSLSAPSISSNIEQLLEKGIIKEVGIGDSAGGRRPIMLEMNYDYGHIVGVDLSSEEVKVGLADLSGKVLHTNDFYLPYEKRGDVILSKLLQAIKEVSEGYKLMAVAIGTPGVLDQKTGTLKLIPQFIGWDRLPISKVISEELKTPVLIKNDINTAAFGETIYGAGKSFSNLCFINIDLGIGAGIVMNRKLYEGHSGAAGEIGYMLLHNNPLAFEQNGYGALEKDYSIYALLDKIKSEVASNKQSILYEICEGNPERINLELVSKAYNLEDEIVVKHVEKMAYAISAVILNLQVILDLELFLIGGRVSIFGQKFLDLVRSTFDNISPIPAKIEYSHLHEKAGMMGAFAIALQHVFENIIE